MDHCVAIHVLTLGKECIHKALALRPMKRSQLLEIDITLGYRRAVIPFRGWICPDILRCAVESTNCPRESPAEVELGFN